MIKCTILVGVPGSGKSTWLFKNMSIEKRLVSTDNIIESLATGYGFTYNDIFKETIRFADMVMVKWMIESAEAGYDLYVDRTNMSVKARKQFIDKLKPYGYEFECVVFPTPEPEEWKRRLDSRPGKTIPQDAIDRMVASYEEPTSSEGFSKITFL
jgi:tRNA uridine 5-carbamoylmethylation protein Kti12